MARVLYDLTSGQTSTQTFTYVATNTTTSSSGTGTVTVVVSGIASFQDSLVAHWTFDSETISGTIIRDVADDTGYGKGDHDASPEDI